MSVADSRHTDCRLAEFRTRRMWARMHARATRGFTRDLLHSLNDLASDRPLITSVVADASGVGSVQLFLAGRQLTLAGLSDAGLRAVAATSALPFCLSGAGRYGGAWWVTLTHGSSTVTILSARLWITSQRGRREVGYGPVTTPLLTAHPA